MSKQNKDFYVWTMAECIKDTYEQWSLDIMSMYDHIKKDFPNATKAIHKIFTDFKNEDDCYTAESLTFKKTEYVYEAVANLIPNHNEIEFDLNTTELSKKYHYLNMCSWGEFVSIKRIDLIMAVLLFTEEFILWPIKSEKIFFTDTELSVEGKFVTLKVSKDEEETCVSIVIKDVIILQYVILN